MSDDRTESEQVVALKAELAQALSRLETLQQGNDRLRQSTAQDRQASLLSMIAQVANRLLRSSDYTTVLADVMRLLGKAAELAGWIGETVYVCFDSQHPITIYVYGSDYLRQATPTTD